MILSPFYIINEANAQRSPFGEPGTVTKTDLLLQKPILKKQVLDVKESGLFSGAGHLEDGGLMS